MPYAQCDACCGDKFYLVAETDEAVCVHCSKKFPNEPSIRERVAEEVDRSHEEAKFKFLAHQGDL